MSFCNCPTVLGFFSPIFVSLCLSVWEVSVDLSSFFFFFKYILPI